MSQLTTGVCIMDLYLWIAILATTGTVLLRASATWFLPGLPKDKSF